MMAREMMKENRKTERSLFFEFMLNFHYPYLSLSLFLYDIEIVVFYLKLTVNPLVICFKLGILF